MIEVEIRAKASHALLQQKLRALQATVKAESHEHDEYFKFAGDVERRLVLRIRQKGDTALLTFKGSSKLPEDVAWQEWETTAPNPAGLKHLLLSNGLVPVVTIDKRRTSYTYQSFEINLDHIAGLGDFIEVELMAEDAALAKRTIEAFLTEQLGISPSNFVQKGYVPLMIAHTQSHS